MDQEKFGNFIKKIRKEHHLTQSEFAQKYHVTYQAVSKWERGLNMPDTSLIKEISKDFNISIDELLDGEYKTPKTKRKFLIMAITLIIISLSLILFLIVKNDSNHHDFKFKTLSTTCSDFNISGNISYNENKSAIYINNIKYCGGDDTEEYSSIECTLYETHNDIDRKISTSKSSKENIKLEDFLQDLTLTIDNYAQTCKDYQDGSLYLSINATSKNSKVTTYKIPLKLESCQK